MKKGRLMWLTPLLLALPIAAGLGYAALRVGGSIQRIIEVASKLAGTK